MLRGFGQPAAGFQPCDLCAVEGGSGAQVEVGDRLNRRESRVSDALAGTGFCAGVGLHRQNRAEVVLEGPAGRKGVKQH